MIRFRATDGGRAAAGFKGNARDCAVRAICNAGGYDYRTIYDMVNEVAKSEKITKRKPSRSSAREGVWVDTMKEIMSRLGWSWKPTMGIGTGCNVHLNAEELPPGPLVVRVSKHYTAVVNGVLLDTYDCSREGRRCVYGYWTRNED